MYKIIGADGQQYGPVSADQIRRWILENRVRTETLAQAEGTTDWNFMTTASDGNGYRILLQPNGSRSHWTSPP